MQIKNFILLSAGQGSRLSQLTQQTHKALLPIAGTPVLQYILDQIITLSQTDIVVVTGYKHNDVKTFVETKYGSAVRTVINQQYEKDTNILSVDLGVGALKNPDLGYMIIETDIILEPNAWRRLLAPRNLSISEWSTIGCYSEKLTGGALNTDKNGRVTNIVYAPEYDNQYEGWRKLLGTLFVGSGQVSLDMALRKKYIEKTIAQYYLMPWIDNISVLKCESLDLSNYYSASFNDLEAYQKAEDGYKRAVQCIEKG